MFLIIFIAYSKPKFVIQMFEKTILS